MELSNIQTIDEINPFSASIIEHRYNPEEYASSAAINCILPQFLWAIHSLQNAPLSTCYTLP
jgi:hypothetical protein